MRTLVLALVVAVANGFTPAAHVAHSHTGAPRTIAVMAEGRRAALSTIGLAALALPLAASADSIEEIAARSNAAAKADSEAKAAAIDAGAEEPDNKSSLTVILAIAAGGTLASTAFYTENLKRLGEKVTTGKGRKY